VTIEKLTALRRGFDRVLLLLTRAVGESFVLRELEMDQTPAHDQHPKANKSRDEERAA
jgi:hypothetical protein